MNSHASIRSTHLNLMLCLFCQFTHPQISTFLLFFICLSLSTCMLFLTRRADGSLISNERIYIKLYAQLNSLLKKRWNVNEWLDQIISNVEWNEMIEWKIFS